MSKDKMCCGTSTSCGGSCPLYGVGMVGALVYYLQLAHGFWPVVVAVGKALVWPALLVYHLLKFIA